jgi:hypothetical protein
MFVIYCEAQVKPEKVELYERTFHDLKKKVHAHEPGVVFYELCKDPVRPNTYRLFEAYRTPRSRPSTWRRTTTSRPRRSSSAAWPATTWSRSHSAA